MTVCSVSVDKIQDRLFLVRVLFLFVVDDNISLGSVLLSPNKVFWPEECPVLPYPSPDKLQAVNMPITGSPFHSRYLE